MNRPKPTFKSPLPPTQAKVPVPVPNVFKPQLSASAIKQAKYVTNSLNNQRIYGPEAKSITNVDLRYQSKSLVQKKSLSGTSLPKSFPLNVEMPQRTFGPSRGVKNTHLLPLLKGGIIQRAEVKTNRAMTADLYYLKSSGDSWRTKSEKSGVSGGSEHAEAQLVSYLIDHFKAVMKANKNKPVYDKSYKIVLDGWPCMPIPGKPPNQSCHEKLTNLAKNYGVSIRVEISSDHAGYAVDHGQTAGSGGLLLY